jgi:NADPH:quinone reductase
MMRGMSEYEFPVTLGRDFAGVVEAVGSAAEGFQVGEEVFGFIQATDPGVGAGSWSEVAIGPAAGFVAQKPGGVDFATAGAAPVAALTAMDAVGAVDLRERETVLIVGATGGVGSFAVQLAKGAGARVIAPGLPEDREYLTELGVDHVIPRDGDVADAVRELEPEGAAALIDTVSSTPGGLDVFAAALADGGKAASPVGAAGEGPGRHNVSGSASTEAVPRLAELLGDGELRVPIQRTYPLERAGAALADLAGEHTQGKLGITVAVA